jgi:hypothetical protein
MAEAKIIAYNASKRKEMRYIKIAFNIPRYSEQRYLVSLRKFEDLGDVWTCQCGGGV